MTDPSPALSSYQKRLFVFLSVATFFEGYDFIAFTQILPNLRVDMNLTESDAGWLMAVINLGTVVAYFLVRKGDRWGRRPLLTLTIAGYTSFTFLTAFSPNVIWFAFFQFVARTFLIAEWATSMVYAAEEFPADRRGMVIGVISASSSLGGIVCAGLAPLLAPGPDDWRNVYLVAIIPLIIVAFARRSLKETQRFAEQAADKTRHSLLHIWRTPYRGRMLRLAAIWGCAYVCSQNAIAVWKDFAVNERSLSAGEAGLTIAIAALASMPLVFAAGKLLDVIGRKPGAVIIFLSMSVGVFFAYEAETQLTLTLALVVAVFGVSAFLPVLNAFNTELFPTELRGDAFAWSNNLLGRLSYVLSPVAIGAIAENASWSLAVQLTAFFPVVALVLILVLLPETKSRELEETASL